MSLFLTLYSHNINKLFLNYCFSKKKFRRTTLFACGRGTKKKTDSFDTLEFIGWGLLRQKIYLGLSASDFDSLSFSETTCYFGSNHISFCFLIKELILLFHGCLTKALHTDALCLLLNRLLGTIGDGSVGKMFIPRP